MKPYKCIRLFAVRVVCLLVLLSGSLAYPVNAQISLRVAIPQGSEKVWSTVAETFEKEHLDVKVELDIFPIKYLREKLFTSAAARRPDFDVVMVRQAWLCEFAEMGLDDLTEHEGEMREEGIAPVRCNDKIFGGEWPHARDWVVSVFKHSRHKEVAFELLLASCTPRADIHMIISRRPLYVTDYERGEHFEDPPGGCVIVWKPRTKVAFVYAVAIAQGVKYEFILTEVTSVSDYEIKGRWTVLRNGMIRCRRCIGKAYGLTGSVGQYFKIYVGTPSHYEEYWHFSGWITKRIEL